VSELIRKIRVLKKSEAMKCVISIFFVTIFAFHVNGQNYCNMQGCTANSHIGCNNNGVSIVHENLKNSKFL
jgi:hypothetical protein